MSVYKGNKLVAGEAYKANDIYSIEETKTDKIWIDGKPIYRKVVTADNFTGSFPVVLPDLEEVVNIIYRRLYYGSTTQWDIGDGLSSSSGFVFEYTTEGIRIITVGSNVPVKDFTATFEYTKTTD